MGPLQPKPKTRLLGEEDLGDHSRAPEWLMRTSRDRGLSVEICEVEQSELDLGGRREAEDRNGTSLFAAFCLLAGALAALVN